MDPCNVSKMTGAEMAQYIDHTLLKPDATQDEIERAARLSGAHDFVHELPEGYDTVLAERTEILTGVEAETRHVAE